MTICTWNSQGYKFSDGIITGLITDNKIDILCLQECGILDNIKFTTHKNIKKGQWKCNEEVFNVLYYEWGGNRKSSRCNMAILVRDSITIHEAVCMEVIMTGQCREPEETTEKDSGEEVLRKGVRGMLHMLIEVNHKCYRIANVHLPSGRPGFARKIGYLFLSMFFMSKDNAIMVGDFNTTPDSWDFKGKIHNLVVADNFYSYPSLEKDLDYMVTIMNPSSITAKVVEASRSDHLPVVFYVP